MNRAALAMIVVLLATGVVLANAGPPPGKSLPTDHTITTDKEYSDYSFYLVTVSNQKVAAVKFDSKTPIEIKGKAGEYLTYRLVAVPKDAEKAFASEEDLHAAIRKVGGVKGQVETLSYLNSFSRVPEADKRARVVRSHTIDKFTVKDGIVFATKEAELKKDDKKKDSPDEETPGVSVYTPRGGLLAAGIAASLAAMLGGFWLAGRTRRKV